MNKTVRYYEQNTKALIKRYDEAEVEELHRLFKKYIANDDKILDVGFGSGRDLRFIKTLTPHLFGIDANQGFVDHLLQDTFFTERVFCSILPDFPKFKERFDVVVFTSVIMHLTLENIEKTFENLSPFLAPKARLILSYSTHERKEERHFEALDPRYMVKLQNQNGFTLMDEERNGDAFGRDFSWVTQVFAKI